MGHVAEEYTVKKALAVPERRKGMWWTTVIKDLEHAQLNTEEYEKGRLQIKWSRQRRRGRPYVYYVHFRFNFRNK